LLSIEIGSDTVEIRSDFVVIVSLDQLVERVSGKGRAPNRRVVSACEEALRTGSKLLEPRVISDRFDVTDVTKDSVVLSSGDSFRSLHLATLMTGTSQMVISVKTIGPGVEAMASGLAGTDMVLSFALDAFGSLAVSTLGRMSALDLESRLTGMASTVSMAPGQLDWSVAEQALVFRLLRPESIGVTLTPSMMMTPVKSTSSVFGVGDPAVVHKGSVACEKCPRRGTCPSRITQKALAMEH
jgi:hypothetical protein